jgi:haloalkane dehalogenase
MKVLRTPDERFEGLADYPFQPRYVEVDDGDGGRLRIHYVDEGPANGRSDAEVVLCLHGQPSWSYLYRKMIPILAASGRRVVAPDLVGFGRSDKPAARNDYSYARHVHWIHGFVRALDLRAVTLVCQDWGGLIGLRVLADDVERFARVVVANTGLPDAQGMDREQAAPMRELYETIPALPPEEMVRKMAANESGAGFMYWVRHCADYPEFRVRDVMRLSSGGRLGDAELAAYDAPFPDESYMQGARQFPSLVPIFPDDPAVADNRRAWRVLEGFERPLLTAFSDADPVTAGAWKRFRESVPGARGQCHVTLHGAGHFLQEDAGETLAGVVVGFCEANPL